MGNLDFEDDLYLDKYKLDEAVEEQSAIYAKWARKYAESITERDSAKDFLELTKAQLDSKVRRDHKLLDLPKVTDTAVSSWIVDQPEYKEALKNFREADKIMNILSVAEKAMGQKKYMIQAAVQLFTSQYYSEPNTNTKEAGKELKRDARNKAISEKISEKMKGKGK